MREVGDPGSGVVDGDVIGINTMIVGRGSGIGFAVSSELARRVALPARYAAIEALLLPQAPPPEPSAEESFK